MTDLDALLDVIELEVQIEAGRSPEYLMANGADPGKLAVAAGRTDVKPQRAPLWTDEEKKFLNNALDTMTLKEIGYHLGRSPLGVKLKMTRLGLNPPSKRSGYLTRTRVAEALNNDIHNILLLHDRGILVFEPAPTLTDIRNIHRIKYWDLLRWVYNPENWPYFLFDLHHEVREIPDLFIRQLIDRRRDRWMDEWWTTGQAADHFGLCGSGVIARYIRDGLLPAVRWGNWHVKRSEVIKLEIRPNKRRRRAANGTFSAKEIQ